MSRSIGRELILPIGDCHGKSPSKSATHDMISYTLPSIRGLFSATSSSSSPLLNGSRLLFRVTVIGRPVSSCSGRASPVSPVSGESIGEYSLSAILLENTPYRSHPLAWCPSGFDLMVLEIPPDEWKQLRLYYSSTGH